MTNKGGRTPHKAGLGHKGTGPKLGKGSNAKTQVGGGSYRNKGTGKSHAMKGGGY